VFFGQDEMAFANNNNNKWIWRERSWLLKMREGRYERSEETDDGFFGAVAPTAVVSVPVPDTDADAEAVAVAATVPPGFVDTYLRAQEQDNTRRGD
jgi:hypothetical protein